MKWKEYTFIDTCLPFGLRSAPKLFNVLADLLTGVLTRQGTSFILHYLDGFLTLGPPASNTCEQNLSTIRKVCASLGIPLALEKVEGPSTALTFLGITLDTINMEARLPEVKLTRIMQLITSWLNERRLRSVKSCPWLAYYNMPPRLFIVAAPSLVACTQQLQKLESWIIIQD